MVNGSQQRSRRNGGDTNSTQIIQFLFDAFEVSNTVSVSVPESWRKDLVSNGVLGPMLVLFGGTFWTHHNNQNCAGKHSDPYQPKQNKQSVPDRLPQRIISITF